LNHLERFSAGFLTFCGEKVKRPHDSVLQINDLEWLPLLPGCGTQHPHRALGGTRVLLAAAPTTPPCFRRWRRSSSLLAMFSGNNIYIFAFGATAFAERSAAMKAPVGLLSGRAVCVSRWRGFAPTSSAERSKRYFHGRGRREKRHFQRRFLRKHGAAVSALALSVTFGDSSPKGRALGMAGKFPAKP
jgi:hypothetical protein